MYHKLIPDFTSRCPYPSYGGGPYPIGVRTRLPESILHREVMPERCPKAVPIIRPSVSYTPIYVSSVRAIPIAMSAMSAIPQPKITATFSPSLETFPTSGYSYFATQGQLISDASNWASYPASQDVNMSNHDLLGVNKIVSAQATISSFEGLVRIPLFSSLQGYVSSLSADYIVAKSLNLNSNILTTAGTELLFNGIPIATTQNISSIADWSYDPAVSTLNMNNYPIIGATNIQISSINGLPIISSITDTAPTWSQYPATGAVALADNNLVNIKTAFTSSVIFQGSNVLTTNGTDLLYNGAAIGGNAGDWATYPAIAPIAVNGNPIQGTSVYIAANPGITPAPGVINLTSGNGTQGQIVLAANPGSGNVSGGNISLTANGGSGIAGLYGAVNIIATEGSAAGIVTGGLINLTATSGLATSNLTSAIKLNAGGINSYAGVAPTFGSLAGYNYVYGTAGVSLIAGLPSIVPNVPGTVYLNGLSGVVVGSGLYASDVYGYWNGINAPNTLTLNGRQTLLGNSFVNINNASNISFDSTATSRQIQNLDTLVFAPGLTSGAITGLQTVNGSAYPPPGLVPVPFSYNIYVSNAAGSDLTGTGVIIKPYQTIGKAMTVANAISDVNSVIINLAAGTYVENVSMTRDNIYLVGGSTSLSSATVIAGIITVDMTGTTQSVVVGGLSSVQFTNLVYANSVAKTQSFILTDCLIVPGLGVSGIVATDTSVGGNGDITIQNCLIYMSDTIAVNCSNCSLNFINTQITNNPALISAVSLVTTTGTGRVSFFGCSLIQQSTVSTVAPLVSLGASGAGAQTMTFNATILQYTSATADTGTGGKCCIRLANSSPIVSVIVINCFMICQGATTTNGSAGQFVVIQRTGAGTVTLNYGQNLAGATANHLPAASVGLTKTPYIVVGN